MNNCRAGNSKTCNHHQTRHQLTNTLYHSKGLDQRFGSTLLERSGSGVWIRRLDRLWDRGLIQTLRFEPQPNAALNVHGYERMYRRITNCESPGGHFNGKYPLSCYHGQGDMCFNYPQFIPKILKFEGIGIFCLWEPNSKIVRILKHFYQKVIHVFLSYLGQSDISILDK